MPTALRLNWCWPARAIAFSTRAFWLARSLPGCALPALGTRPIHRCWYLMKSAITVRQAAGIKVYPLNQQPIGPFQRVGFQCVGLKTPYKRFWPLPSIRYRRQSMCPTATVMRCANVDKPTQGRPQAVAILCQTLQCCLHCLANGKA